MASRKKPEDSTDDESYVAIARGLAQIVAEHNLAELILDTKDVKLTMRRGGSNGLSSTAAPIIPAVAFAAPPHATIPPPIPALLGPPIPSADPVEERGHLVTSPFVGTFYRKPNPDSSNYVSVHDRVDKGQVLCIVEAMKLMNEIEAETGGVVVKRFVQNAQPVEYGEALFAIQINA
jgi:acetyl-CoA carboxylase biotin carboxyl carrier protein